MDEEGLKIVGFIASAIFIIWGFGAIVIFLSSYVLDGTKWHCTEYNSEKDYCVQYERKGAKNDD